MREILFRGKTDEGEWVEGDYLNDGYDYKTAIRKKGFDGGVNYAEVIKVIPETVGQYTGLTDKKGTKIFEGDILKIDGSIYCVQFYNGTFGVAIKHGSYAGSIPKVANYVQDFIEIIGNIHDNPELLGGADNG